ncbi:MAG: hypothetical protein V1750_00725 [Acidobacteriota bacterium]
MSSRRKATHPVPPPTQPLPVPVPSGSGKAPSPWRLVPIWLLFAVAVAYSVTHMNQGVDTFISLAGGRHILAHGVNDVDPFGFDCRPSASAAGDRSLLAWLHPRGWINQNWLTHVFLDRLVSAGGLEALVWFKLLNYLALGLLLVVTARLQGAGVATALVTSAAALVAARDFFEIRGQDITNLVVGLLFLILTLARSRRPRAIWLLPPLFALWANVHGGFVYGLIVLAIFLATELAARRLKLAAEELARVDLRPTLVAVGLSLAATVVLSPYHLANLTHPLAISAGPEAALWRRIIEWRSIGMGPMGEVIPFLLFAGLTLAVLTAAGARLAARRKQGKRHPLREAAMPVPELRFDLFSAAAIVVTVLMALQSRRFIPVACIVMAPPLAAALADLIARWHAAGGLEAAPTTALARLFAAAGRGSAWAPWLLALVAAAAFGTRYHSTFVSPWAADLHAPSLFSRLTYSHLRPSGLCSFFAANQVTGRMWNLWEEGGYLALCQQPDPATGKPPVQIMIDGRAQAAYEAEALRSYFLFFDGGPGAREAFESGRKLTSQEAVAALRWLPKYLRETGITLAHVPVGDSKTFIGRALFNLPNWSALYLDEHNTLFADTDSAAGKALADGVLDGRTRFPDEFSAKLTRAYLLLRRGGEGDLRRALTLAQEAHRLQPSRRAISIATGARDAPELQAEVQAFCQQVWRDFVARRSQLRASHGYFVHLSAAIKALSYLNEAKAIPAGFLKGKKLAILLADLDKEREGLQEKVLW